MLHSRFASEAKFREEFVLPLLSRMGFFGVELTHGQREFGKDFVFGEVTRFGIVKYHAVQVKHLASISQTQNRVIDGLVSQVKQAFVVPFRVTDSARDRFVSSVYVFNSGDITSGAQTLLLDTLAREHFGENVHLLHGSRLAALDISTSLANDQFLRPRLLGLRAQLLLNSLIWSSIVESLPEFSEARGSLLSGIESFISVPFGLEWISITDVGEIWQKARILDTINHRYLMGALVKPEIRAGDIATVRSLVALLIQHATTVLEQIDVALSTLRPIDVSTNA